MFIAQIKFFFFKTNKYQPDKLYTYTHTQIFHQSGLFPTLDAMPWINTAVSLSLSSPKALTDCTARVSAPTCNEQKGKVTRERRQRAEQARGGLGNKIESVWGHLTTSPTAATQL